MHVPHLPLKATVMSDTQNLGSLKFLISGRFFIPCKTAAMTHNTLVFKIKWCFVCTSFYHYDAR